MSVRDLSRITGISPSHILRIESGEFDFTTTKFLRLAEALGLPTSSILEPALFASRTVTKLVGTACREREFVPEFL